MSSEQRQAAEYMYRALTNVPCCCAYEAPYAPRGKLKVQCQRCKAMKLWEALELERIA